MKVTNTPSGVPQIEKKPAVGKTGAKRKVDAETLKANIPAVLDGEISEDARIFQNALDAIEALPEHGNKEKVAALKKSVSAGTYKADSAKTAGRLIDEHLKSDFGKNKI